MIRKYDQQLLNSFLYTLQKDFGLNRSDTAMLITTYEMSKQLSQIRSHWREDYYKTLSVIGPIRFLMNETQQPEFIMRIGDEFIRGLYSNSVNQWDYFFGIQEDYDNFGDWLL